MSNEPTRFVGITLLHVEEGHWWIQDDDGSPVAQLDHRPTDQEIAQFAARSMMPVQEPAPNCETCVYDRADEDCPGCPANKPEPIRPHPSDSLPMPLGNDPT